MNYLNLFRLTWLTMLCTILINNNLSASNYQVSIDFHHPKLKYTDTKSVILCTYYNAQEEILYQESAQGIFPISTSTKNFNFISDNEVFFITLETQGGDAFFIDRILILKDGKILQEHGKDGGTGWCLSTEIKDSKGVWGKFLNDNCHHIRMFPILNKIDQKTVLGEQSLLVTTPNHSPNSEEHTWTYDNNKSHTEINAEGLGRCYDVRFIDPINWSNETLKTGQRASVISLVRDDTKRPARHNNKDYVIPKGVIFTSEILGDAHAESKFVATSYQYEQEVLSSYRANVGVPKAGSAKVSAAFKDVSRDVGNNSSLYTFSKMYKQFYKLDLFFDDPTHQHYIDPRFWNGVKELGQGLSAQEFINKFGTHYASTTYYGGNFLQRRTVTQSQYAYYESNANDFKADVEGTIKKVDFSVGTTQHTRNDAGKTETVKMSSAKIFTIGGDLNQYRPELWSKSVVNNLAVVKVQLTRISKLLTSKNFPGLSNINDKKALLEKAIILAEQQAKFNQSQQQKHNFFTKKSAKFKLTVTYMKCRGHGAKEAGSNSEYYGHVRMGLFNQNGKALKTGTGFKRTSDNHITLALNQTKNLNKSISFQINPADITTGYASVYGNLKEKDLSHIQLSTISFHEESAKIYFRNALDHEVKKKVTFTSKYGDKVEVHFTLRKL